MKLKDMAQVTQLTQKLETVKKKLERFKRGEVNAISAKYSSGSGTLYDAVEKRDFGSPAFWDFIKALVVDRLETDIKILEADLLSLGVEKDDD